MKDSAPLKKTLLIPQDDPHQAHRIRRYLIAVGTSLLVLLLMALLNFHGHLQGSAVIYSAGAMFFFFVLYYVLFRSGLNLRMTDPSLTHAQMLSGLSVIAYAMFHATYEGRGMLLYVFLVTFLFGLFRLNSQQLLRLALFAIALYGSVLAALWFLQPENFHLQLELLRWSVAAVVLFWFALMGGYIGRMRKQLSESNTKLEEAVQKIQDLATRDELTEVPNRRYLMDVLRHEAARSARSGAPFCVCIVDIDLFKRINDQLGHHVGDEVLRDFARGVANETRATDFFGRYGGEEFLLILTHTTLAGAEIRAERLRKSATKMKLPGLGADAHLTISIGVAQHAPGASFEETVKRADEALYRAKNSGRNRVEYAPVSAS
jgi:diguanylate cyclase (GGDEF)-like protein